MKSSIPVLFLFSLFIFAPACSRMSVATSSKPSDTPPSEASPKPAPSAETTKAPAADIAGTYSVTGESLSGDAYRGELTVTNRDDVWQFSWNVGNSEYDGIGVQKGNTIAAAYTTGSDGRGCGAVIYKINSDNSIEGKWGEWGVNTAGTEKAVPNGAVTDTTGNFDVTGSNGNGSTYKGKLKVTRSSDDVYQFSWDVGTKYIGTGVKMGDYLAAGSGSKQCGFVIYEIRNGKLEGRWGVPGTTKLGTETAAKK